MKVTKLTPAIGALIEDVDLSGGVDPSTGDALYQALLDNLVIFLRGVDITPAQHMDFAKSFGQLDEPHQLYPHVEGFDRIMLLDNNEKTPPDTNSWHTDLTYKTEQPFASVLVARNVPPVGGDTMWSSNYAAYDRLSDGMKRDLEAMEAIHDYGDFRNSFAKATKNKSAEDRLNESVSRFGCKVRPLIGSHPVTGRKFLNFNEAFVSQIVGVTTNESNAIKAFLSNHMNKPEDQMRWKWQNGDLAMWDNRVTMHYAIADYLPQPRTMNRITIVNDKRAQKQHAAA